MECIFCKSGKVVRNGKRKRNVKIKQSYLCMKCKRQFVEPDGFERMRHRSEIIVRAIHMHEDGMSLSKIQNHLWQYDAVKITRASISNWERKYSIFLKYHSARSKTPNQRQNSYG